MFKKLLLGACLALTWTASAQNDFRAFFGKEDLIEGGRVDKLTILSGAYQFSLRPPAGWSPKMDEAAHKIVFTAPGGESAITVRFLTNSPGRLPPQEELRDMATAEHSGASVIQTTICPTGYKIGLAVDLVRLPAPKLIQKIREVFVSEPLGLAEISLTARDEEFEKDRVTLMFTTRAFRVERLKEKAP